VWTGRNWRVFHVVSPLAPRSASDPGQPLHPGWQRWIKSWSLDFVSTFDVYWKVPGERLEISTLPSRAFDSPAQYAATAQLAAEYNTRMDLSLQLDARFGKLADERIHAHPLRSYLWLPLGRVADMTLRPRIENIYDDLDWWNASDQPAETRLSWALAAVNLFYLLLGLAGLLLRPRLWLAMLLYLLLRCALLATMEAPEARYTLEFFPILFAAGGIALYGISEQVHLNGQHSLRG
jgi:hypothetical protein